MASALNISSLYLHSVQKLDNKQTEMLCSHNGEPVTRGKQHGIFKVTNTQWIAALKNKKIELDFMDRYQCRYQRKKRLVAVNLHCSVQNWYWIKTPPTNLNWSLVLWISSKLESTECLTYPLRHAKDIEMNRERTEVTRQATGEREIRK